MIKSITIYSEKIINPIPNIPFVVPTFYSCEEDLPDLKGDLTVKPVYFTVNSILYRGEYHMNGWFYAYQSYGTIELMAIGNRDKFVKGMTHRKEHEIYADFWAYGN
jgi:hypothetical protein